MDRNGLQITMIFDLDDLAMMSDNERAKEINKMFDEIKMYTLSQMHIRGLDVQSGVSHSKDN